MRIWHISSLGLIIHLLGSGLRIVKSFRSWIDKITHVLNRQLIFHIIDRQLNHLSRHQSIISLFFFIYLFNGEVTPSKNCLTCHVKRVILVVWFITNSVWYISFKQRKNKNRCGIDYKRRGPIKIWQFKNLYLLNKRPKAEE